VSEDGVMPVSSKLIFQFPSKLRADMKAPREAFHAEVLQRIVAEIPKELTSHPVSEIGRLVAA
jgi:protein required for attachment to host cells